MEESNSTGGSSQHAALLQTVIDLKADLERTMSKMQVMEEQNLNLTQNYNLVKDELVETRHKYNEARENYLGVVSEKTEVERNSESFLEKIKVQLSEKTKEFENMRDQFAPQDLEMIRVKVQQELEVPHKQRIQAMEQEVQKHKDSFFSMKRELETAKAEYESYSINQAREVQSIRDEHESVQAVLREQISRLQEKDLLLEKDDLLRSKNIKLHEVQLSLESALKDARVLQAERDEAQKALDDFRVNHHADTEALKTRVVSAEAAKAGIEGRVAHLTNECEKKDGAIRMAKTSADDSDALTQQARRELAQMESAMANLRIELAKESEDAKIQYQTDRASLLEQLDLANTRLRDREESIRKLTRDVVETQTRAETNESELRRAHLAASSDLKKRLGAAELKIQDQATHVRSSEMLYTQAEESNKVEVASIKSELHRVKREKDALHDKLRESEHNVEAERRKMATLRREVASKSETQAAELAEEKERSKLLDSTKYKVVELETQVASLQQKLSDALAANSSLNEDAQLKLKQLKDGFSRKMNNLDSEAKKEKKRAEAYKSRALEAHNRAKYGNVA